MTQVNDPLDRAILGRLRELESKRTTGLVAKLIGMYLDETPKLIGEMRDAFEAGDADRLGKTAHRLKGGGLDLGVVGLSKLCQELEGVARDGRLDEAGELLSAVDAEFARLQPVLETERDAT